MLARNATRLADHAIFGVKRRDGHFQRVTWSQFLRDVVSVGRFLAEAGVGPNRRVVSFSPNRGETLVVEFATMCLGATYVPIFAGYPAEQARDLIEYADPTVLVVPGQQQLLRACVPQTVRALITLDPAGGRGPGCRAGRHTREACHVCRSVLAGDAGEARTRRSSSSMSAKQLDPDHAVPHDVHVGHERPHEGRGAHARQHPLPAARALGAIWSVTPDDRFLSYLPWHHSFGGIFEKYTALYNGATLYIDDSLGKDFARLLANWMEIEPTVYFSVPQIYQQLVVHAQTHPDEEARDLPPGTAVRVHRGGAAAGEHLRVLRGQAHPGNRGVGADRDVAVLHAHGPHRAAHACPAWSATRFRA